MPIPKTLTDLVFEVPDFVTRTFCDDMIANAEATGFEPATIHSEAGHHVTPDIRNNDRLIIDDADLATTLWPGFSAHFAQPFKGATATSLNPRFRLYRYTPGQFFDWHQDGSYQPDEAQRTLFTVLIYLNAGYEGGGTSFADVFSPHIFSDFTIQPDVGKALIFHHTLSHRGEPVLTGSKYVLRTDVMFRLAQ